MRILLDQNLSPKLVKRLADVLPGLERVYDHDLVGASESFLFDWAARSSVAALISADLDFVHLAENLGPPPKVIRIEQCDFPSKIIEQILRRDLLRIHDFLESKRAVFLLKR